AIERFGIDTRKASAESAAQHVARERPGGNFPERENRSQSGALQLALAIGANVAQEEVAERDGIEAFSDGAAAGFGHAGFVIVVGAGPGERDLPQRNTGGGRLP